MAASANPGAALFWAVGAQPWEMLSFNLEPNVTSTVVGILRVNFMREICALPELYLG